MWLQFIIILVLLLIGSLSAPALGSEGNNHTPAPSVAVNVSIEFNALNKLVDKTTAALDQSLQVIESLAGSTTLTAQDREALLALAESLESSSANLQQVVVELQPLVTQAAEDLDVIVDDAIDTVATQAHAVSDPERYTEVLREIHDGIEFAFSSIYWIVLIASLAVVITVFLLSRPFITTLGVMKGIASDLKAISQNQSDLIAELRKPPTQPADEG